ncbi:hypothetical protein CPB83DRAFT_150789 [Crepidotus variabilis]|uniref:Uncharacterized protein n=1 Tax=Crepidotus variabilis TaxID=179855 RepID=A0A9P6JI59_9AGAR|nr:hypothetical protein CPB83DRAFT_150789 [Crepidotus variabilis]
MRMAGVSLFQGASNVSIGGNSSFNIYYGSMGSGAWLTFVDAAGRTYPVPEYLTWSYHTFLEAINFMLHQDNEVAETQRSLINKGMYDLCIDQGTNIIPINGQESWSKVERDTKIVMRIPIWQTPEEIDSKKTYRCPLPNCNLWNEDPSMGASSTIGCQGCNSRFQVSALLEGKQQEISIPPCSPNEISDTPFLRNFHVQSVSTVTEHTRLGSMLFRRFYKSNSHTNLTYTVEHDKKAIQLTPEGHPKMHVYLAKLGKSLGRRFKHTGNLADIASAIEYCQQAIQLTPEGHSYIPLHLNDLGYSFRLRFEQTGDLADVARTIEYYQKAIQLIPEDDYKIPLYLHDMVQALQLRFKRTGNLADLVSAIEHNQKVIELIWEDHPDMPVRLNNMGSLLEQSFEKTGNSSDRAYAIECYQRALRLTRNTHWRFNKILDRLLHLQDIDDEITTEDAT